eukprot:TRINITY_DN10810_c0_g2_i7.p1 TRINITY_DN10810_c0_g2~~TRINITY_DN10810_c0_g2_i7.p1  ORF type:complete len:124 (+),score=16.77 TRINITY_DN10810_c0_g2_i7:63-434(+)
MQMLHISFKQITFSPTFESLKKRNFALLNYRPNLTIDCKYWSSTDFLVHPDTNTQSRIIFAYKAPEFLEVSEVGNAGNDISGVQKDKEEIKDDEGQGAATLSVKSHVKLKPVELSNTTSAGRL